MSPAFYQFGHYRMNMARRVLLSDGQPVPLAPKVFDTLVELVRRAGQVASKEELRTAVWPDVAVEENSLARNISLLRKTLGESASDHQYIVTIPGRGYSFVAPVTQQDVASQSSPPTTEPAAVSGKQGVFRRRNLGLIAILVSLELIVVLGATLGRPRPSPFQIIRTSRLTSAGRSVKAAISPDGRYIAHTSRTSGQDSLLVRRADTLHDIEIVPSGALYLGLTFSPDGETIYYVTTTMGGTPSVLWRIPVIGGSAQRLKESVDSPVTFSPDGRQYAFIREAAGESALIVADLDSGAERQIASRKLPRVLDYPAWSPDGLTIACTDTDSATASAAGSAARLIAVRVDDRTESGVSNRTWPFIKQVAWMSGGRGLVMTARDQQTGAHHIWHVSYPSGFGRQVTGGLDSQLGVSISADASRIVSVEERAFFGIWRMRSATTENADPVSPESENCEAPVWTPDGHIIFKHLLNGQLQIWSMAADGTDRKQLTSVGNNYYPSISGDGHMLAYVSDRGGSLAIWTMDVDGGNAAMVAEAGRILPQISPDGKWIAFTAVGSRGWTTLWKVASNGGRAVQLNDGLWWGQPSISPDGKWIAGFHAALPSSTQKLPNNIAVISADGRELSKVIPIPPSVSVEAGIRWSADGRELSYVDQRKEGDNVWSRPLDGGAPRQLTYLHGYELFNFDWSRDRNQLVLSRGLKARDVVLIEDAAFSR